MATLPSTLPSAYPLAVVTGEKHDTTRVCHFTGDIIVCPRHTVSIQTLSTTRNRQYTHLVRRSRIAQVKYLDMTIRHAHHHERIIYIKRITPFWESHSCNWG